MVIENKSEEHAIESLIQSQPLKKTEAPTAQRGSAKEYKVTLVGISNCFGSQELECSQSQEIYSL